MNLSTILRRLDACAAARTWAETQPDLQTAWTNCQRSDWMMWLLERTTIDQNDPCYRLMACDFAESVLHLVPADEDRPRRAIETARAFVRGEATRDEMIAAWDAASAAAWDAASASASAAACAAVSDAACAAASDAASSAASAAASDAARASQANIIRHYFPQCPEINPELLCNPKSNS